MKRIIQLINYAFLLIILPSCAQQPTTFESYKKTFAADFKKDLAEKKVTNASYAVFSKDSLIFQDNFSGSNSEIDANTPFLIGSVTKVFTAVAVMQLYEQGKIDIDKPVSDYITDFKIKQRFPESEPITVRAVLTHHAGIPSDIYLNKFSKKPQNFNIVLDYLNAQSTCYPVGKIWAYSNLGYALLGILVERVSGLNYDDYIAQNIFKQLSMTNSGMFSDFDSQRDIANAHNAKGEKRVELPLLDKPAGAIYSTVNDMIKFCRSFIDGKEVLLKNKTLVQMFELQNRDNLLDLNHRQAICFNFKNKAYEIGRIFEHGGATMYHRAQIAIAPDAGLAAVMLSDSPKGSDNAWKLDEKMMVEYCSFNGIKPDKSQNTEKKMKFELIRNQNLKDFAGSYAMPGMVCSIEWKNGHLSPAINGENFYLARQDSTSFVPAKRYLGIMLKSKKMYFLLEELYGEKHLIQVMPWGGLTIIGTQTDTKPIPAKWKQREGKYEIADEISAEGPSLENISISEDSGFLVFKFSFNADMSFGPGATLALDIQNDNDAYVIGYGRGGGERVSFNQDGKSFEYMGVKFKLKN